MIELYSTLNPNLVLGLLMLSVLGVAVQSLYHLTIWEGRLEKIFEGFVLLHLIIISLSLRRLNAGISSFFVKEEIYFHIRWTIGIVLLLAGLYIVTKKKERYIYTAIPLIIMSLPSLIRLPYGVYSYTFTISLILFIIRGGKYYSLEKNKRENMISPHSIKEALDTQQGGISFVEKGGNILLINSQMLILMKAITGRYYRNGERFWEDLKDKPIEKHYYTSLMEDRLIWKLENSSWLFQRKKIEYKGKEIYQIIATDVTEQETINQQLKEYGKALKDQQNQLKTTLQNIEDLRREEAISRSWEHIHGVLGQHISILERSLSQEPGSNHKSLLSIVDNLKKDLQDIREEQPEDIYQGMKTSFASLNIGLHRKGSLPQDERLAHFYIEIIREGINNALRHGNAQNIYISIEDEEKHILTLTNDGDLPREIISWGGGLTNIAHKVKDLEGTIKIDTRPGFKLLVEIPKNQSKKLALEVKT